MSLDDLRKVIDAEIEHGKKNDDNRLLMGPNGPVGIKFAEAVHAVLKDQERRIKALEDRSPQLDLPQGDAVPGPIDPLGDKFKHPKIPGL